MKIRFVICWCSKRMSYLSGMYYKRCDKASLDALYHVFKSEGTISAIVENYIIASSMLMWGAS
jgi:hypothetical protein